MAKRREYPDAHEINVTPVMNLFICLIPFLLITAVFVQISIIETNAPAREGGAKSADGQVSLVVVMISPQGFSVGASGELGKKLKKTVVVRMKKGGGYDYVALRAELVKLKQLETTAQDLLIIADAHVKYSVLVDTMDTARETGEGDTLFPNAFFGGTV